MKIAIITDQHFGARKNSKLFHDYFLKFYNDIFFPTLEKEGITTVIDMGDTFDSRKGIDFSSLKWSKDNYFGRLDQMGIELHTIVGNHTAYYKNTNDVNAISLLLNEYDNISVYPEATEIKIDNLNILLVPWINSENEKRTLKLIENSKSPVCMGHLEFKGFKIHAGGFVMDHGTDYKLFKNFDKVFSGHYHTRSTQDNISYLGNPYEIYWNDVNDPRGFHLFDTETLELTTIDNPYRMFYTLYYDDTPHQMLDITQFEDKILKLIVRKKTDPKKFEQYIDKLYASNCFELKIVEGLATVEDEEFDVEESEDTISILNRYIQEAEVDLDKSIVTNIIQDVYKEACEVE